MARLPLVVLNMARAQGDYYQATRGGGHGDYRHIVLAPWTCAEAVELVAARLPSGRRVAQSGAGHAATTTWPTPHESVTMSHRTGPGPCPRLGPRRIIGRDRPRQAGLLLGHRQAARRRRLRPRRPLPRRAPPPPRGMLARRWSRVVETGFIDDAELVVVAFGTPARYVRARGPRAAGRRAGRRLRAPDHPLAVPAGAVADAAAGARSVAVYENNQRADDRRRPPGRARPRPRCTSSGGISLDSSGFGIAPDLDGRDPCSPRSRADPWAWSASSDATDLPSPTDRPPRGARPGWSTTSRPR